MSAISAGLGVLIDNIANPSSAGPGPVDGDTFDVAVTNIAEALTILKDTMDSADSKSREAVTAATDVATQIEVMGGDVKNITEHTVHVIIPHSMSWLAGYVVAHWIDPLRHDVAGLKHAVAKLEEWQREIITWRRRFVDPNLALWIGFREWFNSWPRSVLFRWHEWFAKPDEFAQWAAPPLTGPIVSYLAAPAHKQTRDSLMLILMAAWAEEPHKVLDAIEVWLNH